MSPNDWDEIYRRKEDWGTGTEPSDFHLEAIMKLSIDKPALLDIGCGNGGNVKTLVHCASVIDLFDPSVVAIQIAKANLPRDPKLKFSVNSIEHAVLPIEHYDVVFFCGVLNCVPRALWPSVCKNVATTVRPDALLIFTVFNEMSDPSSVDSLTILDLGYDYRRCRCEFRARSVRPASPAAAWRATRALAAAAGWSSAPTPG